MGALITEFIFKDHKNNTIATTADMDVMADIRQFSAGNPFTVGSDLKFKFDEDINTYKILNFECYPYNNMTQADDFQLQGVIRNYSCQIIIYLQILAE